MKNNALNGTSKLLLAAVGGALVGSAIGVLFAPDRGEKTRKRLMKKATSVDDDIDAIVKEGKKSWNNVKDSAQNTVEDLDTYLEHILTEGKKSWEKMKAEATNKAENVQQETESTLTKVVNEGKKIWNAFSSKTDEVVDTVKTKTVDAVDTMKTKAQEISSDVKENYNYAENQARKFDSKLS